MKVMNIMEELGNLGKSPKEKQSTITVNEVSSIWNLTLARYDIIETTNILDNFCKDEDLKMVIQSGKKILVRQVKKLENLMQQYGIPMPAQPPKEATSTLQVEVITDRYIFRVIFNGVQGFLHVHLYGITRSSTSRIRSMLVQFLIEELDIHDNLYEFGKMKGYLNEEPAYRT